MMRSLFQVLLCSLALLCCGPVRAQVAGDTVQLPCTLNDGMGVNWDIQMDGSVGDGGNDQYDGGGHLYLDGNIQWQSERPQAQLDRSNNELIFAPVSHRGLRIARRVAVDPEKGYCRWAEVIENPTERAISVQLLINFNYGTSLTNVQPIRQAKTEQTIGLLMQDGRQKGFAVITAGRKAKVLPQLDAQLNNDDLNIACDVQVPPRKTVVLVHVQAPRMDVPGASSFAEQMSDRDYIATLPRELRRCVINFPTGESLLGDLEMLRGDLDDLIELPTGDLLHGTVHIGPLTVDSDLGPLHAAAGEVVSIMRLADAPVRHLVICADGQMLSGRVDGAVKLMRGDGVPMEIPLASIARVGMRRRPGEGEQLPAVAPSVHLVDMSRLAIAMPGEPVQLATRFGRLALPPAAIQRIDWSEASPLARVHLRDGGQFAAAGLADGMPVTISRLGKTIDVPMHRLARLVLDSSSTPDSAAKAGTLTAGEDALVGSLVGSVHIETAFEQIAVDSGQIASLRAMGQGDVQLALGDRSVISGRLMEKALSFQAGCGPMLSIPTGLVQEYVHPRPQIGSGLKSAIEKLVIQLEAMDDPTRQDAERKLIHLGSAIIPQVQELSKSAPPQVQQLLSAIIKQIESAEDKKPAPQATPEMNNGPAIPQQFGNW